MNKFLETVPVWLILYVAALALVVCGLLWIPLCLFAVACFANSWGYGLLKGLKLPKRGTKEDLEINLHDGNSQVIDKKAVTVTTNKKPVIFSNGKTVHYAADVLGTIEEVYVLLIYQHKDGKHDRLLQRQVAKNEYDKVEVGKEYPAGEVYSPYTPRIIWEVNGVALDIVDQLNEIREKFKC